MAYSKQYQTKTAGRVREDEDGFNKKNLVATPARVFGLSMASGKKQPTVDIERMNDDEMGKRRSTVSHAVKSSFNPAGQKSS